MLDAHSVFVSELSTLGRKGTDSAEFHITVANVDRNSQLASRLALAGDSRTRTKGLLGRERLDDGEGLWIVPCEAVHTFWMRFPLDLVYLDRNHRVLKTASNVRPWRVSACLRAHSVLELPAGTIFKTQTMPGDSLSIKRVRS